MSVDYLLFKMVRSEKLTDDKTQISAMSADFTQLTGESEENDKQSSKTLTESTKEKRNHAKLKNESESGTQNISISQLLSAAQSKKKKQQSEVEESGSTEESTVSPTKDPKQSSEPPARSIKPG